MARRVHYIKLCEPALVVDGLLGHYSHALSAGDDDDDDEAAPRKGFGIAEVMRQGTVK